MKKKISINHLANPLVEFLINEKDRLDYISFFIKYLELHLIDKFAV